MKLTTIILLGIVIFHQLSRPVLDASLLVELCGLALFYFVGRRIIREHQRATERKKYLRGVQKRYLSKNEPKPWRANTETEVKVEKFDFFDKL